MKKEVWEKIKNSIRPGDIIYSSSNGFIQKIIKAGQSLMQKKWLNEIGHVGFIDKDMNVVESTISISLKKTEIFPFFKVVVSSGIHIRPIESWNTKNGYAFLAIQRIEGLTEQEIDSLTEYSKRFLKIVIKYPIIELFGTFIAYLNYNLLQFLKPINRKFISKCQEYLLKKPNPFDKKSAMYCISLVNEHFYLIGKPLIDPKKYENSIVSVWQGLMTDLGYSLIFMIPQLETYKKNPYEEFNLDINI